MTAEHVSDEEKLRLGRHVYLMMDDHAAAWAAYGSRQNIGAFTTLTLIDDQTGGATGIWEISVKRISSDYDRP